LLEVAPGRTGSRSSGEPSDVATVSTDGLADIEEIAEEDDVWLGRSSVVVGAGELGTVYRGELQGFGPGSANVAVKKICPKPGQEEVDFLLMATAHAHKMQLPLLSAPFIDRLLVNFASAVDPPCRLFASHLADMDYFTAIELMNTNMSAQGLELASFNNVRILADVLTGLAVLHRHKYLHRDIKPENILLYWDEESQRHRASLSDLEFLCNWGVDASEWLGCRGSPGTDLYFSPDMWLDDRVNPQLDDKHDMFAVGLTFLGVLHGTPWQERLDAVADLTPFDAATALVEMAHTARTALQGRGPVAEVLRKMLHRDPEQRCSAKECLANLEKHLQHPGEASRQDWYFEDLGWGLGMLWPMA